MIIRIKRANLESGLAFIAAIFIVTSILIGVSFTADYAIGSTNITNNSVLARVNVTNTEPNITSVTVDDGVAPANEIDLVANTATIVTCNATVFDYNGWGDINSSAVNATFHIQSVGISGSADNNERYKNGSCGSCRQASESANPTTTAYCDCKFAVQYYANDSNSWVCNVTVEDLGGTAMPAYRFNLSDTAVSSTVTINKLLAINTSGVLDFGNLSVTETSPEITFNVTNAGNINFNLSLRGYGGENESVGQNLSMICGLGNITFNYERYALGTDKSGLGYDLMSNLTNQTFRTNLTINARIDDTAPGWDRNSTLWRLQVPLSVGGICNGTLIFGAVDSEV